MILKRAGDDFGSRGRAAVDQQHHRLAIGQVTLGGVEALGLVGMAAARRDDFATVKEAVGNRDRHVQQSARIVAEVEDVTLGLAAHGGAEVVHRLLEAFLRLLGEGGDADIADVVALDIVFHRLDADAVARQFLVEGLAALALDGQRDLGADLAAHLVDGVIQGHALDFRAVDLGDQVVGHDAGARRRRIVDGRHHLDDAVLHGDFYPQAAEFAPRLDTHVLELLGVHEARMRIERHQHAVDRRLDHLGFIGLFHIIGANTVEHVAKQVKLLVGIGVRGRSRRPEGMPEQGGGNRARHNQTEILQSVILLHPRASFEPPIHHGPESIASVLFLNSI